MKVKSLVSLLVVLQVLDGVLTFMGVSRFGVAAEGNPILAYLIQTYGSAMALVTVKLGCILGCAGLTFINDHDKVLKGLLAFVCLIYIKLAVIPWVYVLLTY